MLLAADFEAASASSSDPDALDGSFELRVGVSFCWSSGSFQGNIFCFFGS